MSKIKTTSGMSFTVEGFDFDGEYYVDDDERVSDTLE